MIPLVVIFVALAARVVWLWRDAGPDPCNTATHDWDTETYCTADGCQRPATHQQPVGVTANGDTIVEYVCCQHQGEHTT